MLTTALVALGLIDGAGGNPLPPPAPTDTHDGFTNRVIYRDDKPNHDRFDRQGILAEIERVINAAKDEGVADEKLAPVETAIRAEISRPDMDSALLAGELERLASLVQMMQSAYDDVNRVIHALYEQDEEDALTVILLGA